MALRRTVDADTEALHTAVEERFEDADYGSVMRAQPRLEPSTSAASDADIENAETSTSDDELGAAEQEGERPREEAADEPSPGAASDADIENAEASTSDGECGSRSKRERDQAKQFRMN